MDWRLNSILKLTTGLMGLEQYNDQEHLWGYRYIYKSFIDEHGFGTCADLGANIEIKPIDMVKVNLFVLNGLDIKRFRTIMETIVWELI